MATFIIGWLGNRAILAAIAAVAILNISTTAIMVNLRRAETHRAAAGIPPPTTPSTASSAGEPARVSRIEIGLIMLAFVLLQAANATGVAIMTVYVTQTLQLDIIWAGIALGVAAAVEVPALLIIGRISDRYTHLGLIATSCIAGIGYYLGLAFVQGPVLLITLQLLNAWSFAGIAGIGLTLFQTLIPRPGLSTGLYMNTRRIGSIVSGPMIAVGTLTVLGQRGIFLASATVTLLGLAMIAVVHRTGKHRQGPI